MATSLQRILYFILALALVLRLLVALSQPDHASIYTDGGGDSGWYLIHGYALMSGSVTGSYYGMRYDISVLPTAPLYLVFVGVVQHIVSDAAGVIIIRILQCLMGTALVFFAYRMARKLTTDDRVGLVAAAIIAISPAFVLESAYIMTETLYLFLLTAGIWVYIEWLPQHDNPDTRHHWRWLIVTGILIGLATLTRAVLLAFPVGLGIHLLLVYRHHLRRVLLWAAILLIAYTATVSTWTVYNLVRHDRFVIVSNQLLPALWRGAVAEDGSPEENDALLQGSSYGEQAAEAITGDTGGYINRRIQELSAAYTQPHGTIDLGGESLRDLASRWLRDDLSLSGLSALITADGFWPKLLIYIFHYGGILLGLVGMWLSRHTWRVSLVYMGFIAYTTLAHLVFLALPRYIFPVMLYVWLFAAVTIVWFVNRARR